ncbi:MAG TPA: hypothetical protein VMT76_00735 [Puia sp.]|nr:hypothetical protein [Puia sp.]
MIYLLKKTIFILFVAAILIESCYTKVYPDDKLLIDPQFSSIFYSLIQKDSLQFSSSNNRSKMFIITKVDSIVSNEKGWFINEKPYKLLQFEFREIGKDTVRLERQNEVFVNKNPEKNQNSIAIQFNNFYYHDTILPLLHHTTFNINNKKFTDYFMFETSLHPENPDDVKVLYINVSQGFLGFETLSGEIWVNNVIK